MSVLVFTMTRRAIFFSFDNTNKNLMAALAPGPSLWATICSYAPRSEHEEVFILEEYDPPRS